MAPCYDPPDSNHGIYKVKNVTRQLFNIVRK